MTSPGLGGAKLGFGGVALGRGLNSPDRFKVRIR
jgi:fumarate hydratase class II